MARLIAKDHSHGSVGACHLLKSVLHKEAGLTSFLHGMQKDVGYMREWADMRIDAYPKSAGPVTDPDPDPQVVSVLREADYVKIKFGRGDVDALCLLTALCTAGVGFSYEQLKSFPLQRQDIMDHLLSLIHI